MSNAGRNMCGLAIVLVVALQAGAAYPITGQFGLEFAIDAPWRLEPVPASGGGVTYGPIPITITFHDAIYDHYRSSIGQALVNFFGGLNLEKRHVGTLKYIDVQEGIPGDRQISSRLQPGNLREIERKRWISTKQNEPFHELCRFHLGQDCRPLYDITDSHEWHAMFWYTPTLPITPGRNINLLVKVVTTYEEKERHWTNGLVVHAGEAPLPRFSSQWLYGDLHYHSQMTDNEGESAYSYRNVVRTLGALGMDFLFATDHASDSEQVDGGLGGVGRCGSMEGTRCAFNVTSDFPQICKEGGQTKQCIGLQGTEARDLNQNRFTVAKQILYGSDGANEAIARDLETGGFARYRAEGIVPQIFMGEEVDAWPEMSLAEYEGGVIAYGDRKTYAWPDVSDCLKKTSYSFCSLYHPEGELSGYAGCANKPIKQLCRERFSTVKPGPRHFTQDNQGIPHLDIQPEPSRQHLVYFPLSGLPDGNGFVPSRTRKYGGASRTLDDVVREIESKGVTFLAHPMIGTKPGGKEGPDIVPYSQLSLDTAWRSRAVLGLQFWNENGRLESKVNEGCSVPPALALQASTQPAARQQAEEIMRPCRRVYETRLSDGGKAYTSVAPFLGMWAGGDASKPWTWRAPDDQLNKLYAELYHGAFTWDRYLRKGLISGEIAQLSAWLPAGEPRKWFMAGGSDGHGDFNYRRYGYLCAAEWCESSVGDTAIGNPRNLVFVGPPSGPSILGQPPGTKRRHTNEQVITALQAGNFSVTDGPALRLVIDRNRDGKLTDGLDFPMGSTFNLFPKEQVPILIEWISSPEFGRVKKIDVYVGTKDRTYVPTGHGPPHAVCLGPNHTNCDESFGAYLPGWTVLQVDLTGVDPSLGYHGMAKIYLNPYDFGITLEDKRLFYVRAYAQTFGRTAPGGCTEAPLAPGKCGDRLAYSNPVWGRYHAVCDSARFASTGRQSIDRNNDGLPDTCQAPLPDPCPAPPPSTLKGGAAAAGVMAPSTGTLAVDPQGQTGAGGVGTTLRSCKIVTAVFGNLVPTVVQPGPKPTIMSRGLEKSEQPVESQEPDLLFIEVPEGSGEQKEGLQQTEPKDK